MQTPKPTLPSAQLLANDTFLRACLGLRTDYTPVWLMRQAGRYLPEYRALRAQAGSFMALATNPQLAVQATLQPLERFALDAAIVFSDILTVPDAMGLGLNFQQGEGPRFARPVQDEAAVARLAVPDMNALRYVFDTITLARQELRGSVPLIGFAGSPWTLACYMVKGAGSRDFYTIKHMMYARPDLLHRILQINADSVAAYLNAQIDAGAQAVMIFDSWGGVLADGDFQTFSLAYTQRVLQQLQSADKQGNPVPRIVYTKGGGQWLAAMRALDCQVLGVDWTVHLGRARALLQAADGRPTQSLQGNLDPAVLLSTPQAVVREVQRTMQAFHTMGEDSAKASASIAADGTQGKGQGKACRHIFNLGHGISPDTPPEHVTALIEAVHAYG